MVPILHYGNRHAEEIKRLPLRLLTAGIWKWMTSDWYPAKPEILSISQTLQDLYFLSAWLWEDMVQHSNPCHSSQNSGWTQWKKKGDGQAFKHLNTTTSDNNSAAFSSSLMPFQRQEAHVCRKSNRHCATLWSVFATFSSFFMWDIPQYRLFFFEIDNQLPLAVLFIVFECLDKQQGRRKQKQQAWRKEKTTLCSLPKTN